MTIIVVVIITTTMMMMRLGRKITYIEDAGDDYGGGDDYNNDK